MKILEVDTKIISVHYTYPEAKLNILAAIRMIFFKKGESQQRSLQLYII